MLGPRLAGELVRLEEERRAITAALNEKTTLEKRACLSSIRSATDSRCAICVIDAEGRARIRADAAALARRLEDVAPEADADRLEQLSEAIVRLRAVAPAGVVGSIALLEGDLDRGAMRLHRYEEQVDKLQAGMREANPAEIDRHHREHQKLIEHAGKLKTEIEAKDEVIRRKDAEIDDLQRAIAEKNVPATTAASPRCRARPGPPSTAAAAPPRLEAGRPAPPPRRRRGPPPLRRLPPLRRPRRARRRPPRPSSPPPRRLPSPRPPRRAGRGTRQRSPMRPAPEHPPSKANFVDLKITTAGAVEAAPAAVPEAPAVPSAVPTQRPPTVGEPTPDRPVAPAARLVEPVMVSPAAGPHGTTTGRGGPAGRCRRRGGPAERARDGRRGRGGDGQRADRGRLPRGHGR